MRVWWVTFGVCVGLIQLTVSLPAAQNATDQESQVPLEFPQDSQNYPIVDNSSIRENLASHADVDTEVEDLLDLNQGEVEDGSTTDKVPKIPQEDTGRKSNVEWIENGDDTEDAKFEVETSTTETTTTITTERESTVNVTEATTVKVTTNAPTTIKLAESTTVKSDTTGPYKDGVPIMDGSVAAILAAIFLVICIFGYTALIIWRKSLEIKYGSREMLVDKDEIYDPDDMRHFSI